MILGQYITIFSVFRDKLVTTEAYVSIELFLNYSSLTSVLLSLGIHQWFSVEYFKTKNITDLGARSLITFLILSPLLFYITFLAGYGSYFFYAWTLFFKNFVNAYLVASKKYKLFMYNELSSAIVFWILLIFSLLETRWFFIINTMSVLLLLKIFIWPSIGSLRDHLKITEILSVIKGGASFMLNGLALWLIFTSDLWVLNEFEDYSSNDLAIYSSILRLSKIGAFVVFFYVGNRVNIDLMHSLKKVAYESFNQSLKENIRGILKKWFNYGCLLVVGNLMLYYFLKLTGIGSFQSDLVWLTLLISAHMMFELLMRMISPLVYFYDKKIFLNAIYLVYFLFLVGTLKVLPYNFILVKSALLFLLLIMLILGLKLYGRRSHSSL